jgi:hypothetical protein
LGYLKEMKDVNTLLLINHLILSILKCQSGFRGFKDFQDWVI